MEDEVGVSGVARRGWAATAGGVADDRGRTRHGSGTGQHTPQSCPYSGQCANVSVTGEDAAIPQEQEDGSGAFPVWDEPPTPTE